jgi:hypothetical protein
MAKPTTEVAVAEPLVVKDHWLILLIEWPFRLLGRLAWWLLRKLGEVLWRYRDLHWPWWTSVSCLACSPVLHEMGAAWWLVLAVFVAAAAIGYAAERRFDRLPVEPETVAGAVVVLGGWAAAGAAWGAVRPVAVSWLLVTLLVWCVWWRTPAYRMWRHLRLRVRNWQAMLPVVLAELGSPGVAVVKVVVDGTGRVLFYLRLPVKVTRRSIEKLRDEITSGMHWPDGSIREVITDDGHRSAARVVLVWQDGHIQARAVRFDPEKRPQSVYDPLWLGHDDQGRDVLVEQYAREGMTRGLYGGEPGSAKSNLLRLIVLLRAYCPDVLIWVIDRKNSGLTFASLLPRIDWIATDRDEATRMLQAAAAGIPLRGRLLLPEHNQLLPMSADIPAVVIVYDEFAGELGKAQKNRPPIDAALDLASKGRATGWGAEIASQYLSKTSLDPDLKPLFTRSFAGRTRTKADAQFLLKEWNRVDTTTLPTGAFYVQLPGEARPLLAFTPEVTDAMLQQAANETANLAPQLEESTAERLPHYPDRWTRLPDHLRRFCSAEQLELVDAAPSAPPPVKIAAARRQLLMVSEPLTAGEFADNGSAKTGRAPGEFVSEPIAAMCELLLTKGRATTGELDKASGRSRQWGTERRTAWVGEGLIRQVDRGVWELVEVDGGRLAAGAARAETMIRSRRSSRGGDGQ